MANGSSRLIYIARDNFKVFMSNSNIIANKEYEKITKKIDLKNNN